MSPGRRVAFLDRDGVVTVPQVLDGKGFAVRRVDELRLYDDAADSVARLAAHGFDVVIVTNQPDLSTGLIDDEELAAMHSLLARRLRLTSIRVCPHVREDACGCRKPATGMLLAEDAASPVDWAASWMVGDRDSDVAAGLAVGCRTVFIERGWRAETGGSAHVIASTLAEAVDTILAS